MVVDGAVAVGSASDGKFLVSTQPASQFACWGVTAACGRRATSRVNAALNSWSVTLSNIKDFVKYGEEGRLLSTRLRVQVPSHLYLHVPDDQQVLRGSPLRGGGVPGCASCCSRHVALH